MAILKTTPTLAVLAVLGGCDFVREPTFLEFVEERVAVHSLLVAGDDTAVVLLTRAAPGGTDPFTVGEIEPVTGATVRIIHDADTLDLAPASVGPGACLVDSRFGGPPRDDLKPGCYTAFVAGGVRAGESYELLVRLAGGATIHGSATVPRPPTLLAPAAGAELEASDASRLRDPDVATPVTWTAFDADLRLELTLRMARPECEAMLGDVERDFGQPTLEVTGRDAATVWVNRIECDPTVEPDPSEPQDPQDPPDEARRLDALLTLTVYDSAYTRYARENLRESTRRVDAAVGITGAIGVFGGAASASVPVVVVVDDP